MYRIGSFIILLLVFGISSNLSAQSYPRIVNLYGAGLQWMEASEGMPYWTKLGMIVGGSADFHNDYENKETLASAERASLTATLLKKIKPEIIILPYFDIIEGPDNLYLPADFWLKGADGKRISTWPGFWRVDTARHDVLNLTASSIKANVYSKNSWNGVFLDCWEPDTYLVPTLHSLPGNKYIVTNCGSLPSQVSSIVNGAMSEDELNRVASGNVKFSDLFDRYLRWCQESAKPVLTIISCYPRSIDPDPWLWAKRSEAERNAILEKGRIADMPMMRFGLCFTLMGDGFFTYDGGTQIRGGTHWWYPEYDIDLGKPVSAPASIVQDFWKRNFENGQVFVNGSQYDETIQFQERMKDVSTGRIAKEFVIPRLDGRIFVPTTKAENTIPIDNVIFSRKGSTQIIKENSPDGSARWQFPNGLELYFGADAFVSSVVWKGETIIRGGYPDIALKGWISIQAKPESTSVPKENLSGNGIFEWKGSSVWTSDKANSAPFLRDRYSIRATIGEDGSVSLEIIDSFEILSVIPLEMWRNFVFLPVDIWKGRSGMYQIEKTDDPKSFIFPLATTTGDLADGKVLKLSGDGYVLEIQSDDSHGLVDHRQWGTQDYLWASYPAPKEPKKGNTFSTRLVIKIN